MHKNNKNAFTFVELIVVITIMAILATIGFGVYQSYLAGGRDTNRLVQLKDIHDGLERYSINSRLPLPENMIEIQANGNTFAYQGDAGDSVIKTIGYDGGGKDIETGVYLTYMLGSNGRDFQLMTYLKDSQLLSNSTFAQGYANQDFNSFFPKLIGLPLGVLVDENTNTPIQMLDTYTSSGKYDINSTLPAIKSYLSDNKILSNSGDDNLLSILPNHSCNRILNLGKSTGNGIYRINPDGNTQYQVYCDMETEGGGWMYAGFIHEDSNYDNVYFDREFGGYNAQKTSSGSSYMLDLSKFSDTQALFLFNTNDIQEAEKTNNLVILSYQESFPGMNTGPLSSASTGETFFGGYNLQYKTRFEDSWKFTGQNTFWGFSNHDGTQEVMHIRSASRGVEKYTGAWGDSPDVRVRDNAAYIYIR